MPVCIYHGNCADGFTAAWAVIHQMPDATFIPGHYGKPLPDISGEDVVFVDFSAKRPELDAFADKNRSVLVLDHHASAEAELAEFEQPHQSWYDHLRDARRVDSGYVRAAFDMERSGAQMAWDYFNSALPRPKLVDYVADRDLWRFDLPHSKAISMFIFAHEYDFRVWDKLSLDVEHSFEQAVMQGAAIQQKHAKDIDELLAYMPHEISLQGKRCLAANLPYTYASDAAGELARRDGYEFGATYFDRGDGKRSFSLRSRGYFDVSKLAVAYGGGGHKNAAGFEAAIGWLGDEDA